MKLLTKVDPGRCKSELLTSDKVFVIGSCFADNVGAALARAGFDVCVNPFGTLFNPVSVSNAIARLHSGIPFTEKDSIEMGANAGLYCSFQHHTSFARKTVEEFLENANSALVEACDAWKGANKVIITLGTAWCYRRDGAIVSNCLKRPAGEFERIRLSVGEVAAVLKGIVAAAPGKEFIFTVSPVRHLADGAYENQLSKSSLLLATEIVCKDDRCSYFSAYEIMMDELRDYRFYAEDMIHPSTQAINYIWECFQEFAVPEKERVVIAGNEKEWKAARHRPMH